jgi:predicted alpha/beta hydrolase family esterase
MAKRMTKRLVITGLACSPEVWEKFLARHKGQRILPIAEVFENCPSPDLREMAKYVASQIEAYQPDSIIAHDVGVPLTMLSLSRLRRKGKSLPKKVTFFNGAFRHYDVFKAPHAFRVQFMSARRAVQEVQREGGKIDPRLKKHLPRIRAMYRMIILFSLTEKISSLLGLDEFLHVNHKTPVKVPVQVQIIASRNDPYIPYEAVQHLRKDLKPRRFIEMDYGHFPYSIDRKSIVPLVEEFEGTH